MQFRTKARAVELLGKGQIADLPTAITELWKNGYDAYADTINAGLYMDGYKGLSKPVFLITDDGKGMSRQDIFDKWLVLGVDTKARNEEKDKKGPETLWKEPRIKSGEKGIGRLSVAFLGSPMLMLTKKIGEPLQVLFFDWRILENYNLFIDDIEIPVLPLENEAQFNDIFEELKSQFLKGISRHRNDKKIWEESQEELLTTVFSDVEKLELPVPFEDEVVSGLFEKKAGETDSHGTKFVIFNPEQQIIDLADPQSNLQDNANDSENVLSSLLGFMNVFEKREKKVPSFSFIIHRSDILEEDLLQKEGNYFVPDDFEDTDVLIEGEFDGKGCFSGAVKIYDETVDYTYQSARKKWAANNYGRFSLKIGYVIGVAADSQLSDTKYTSISKKLDNYGGLYLYRDNFRILPYGRKDADFLQFEERRSRKAGYYFFSYRRMFGYIALTRAGNPQLKDKSSREGLINNAAYRAFVYDLKGFFKDLALEYFATDPKQELFKKKKELIAEKSKEIEKDKKREKIERIRFSRQLNTVPDTVKQLRSKYTSVLTHLKNVLQNTEHSFRDIQEPLTDLTELELEFDTILPKMPEKYTPTETQEDKFSELAKDLYETKKELLQESSPLVIEARTDLKEEELKSEFKSRATVYLGHIKSAVETDTAGLSSRLKELSDDFRAKSDSLISGYESFISSLQKNIHDLQSFETSLDNVKKKYETAMQMYDSEIKPLVNHLQHLSFDVNEDLLEGAYKTEYERIKKQWEQVRDTAQLGIAVEIIDHEFNFLYGQIHKTLDMYNTPLFADNAEYIKRLRTLFTNLEEKYTLFSPLYRISDNIPKEIRGKALYNYLSMFFENILNKNEISFTSTKSFDNHVITIKETVIHTVLINVINNAQYWVGNSEIKKIELDYRSDTDEIIIRDSGISIDDRKLERIFDLFYTTRPNGRGIGLYLSKESLNGEGFDIYATNDINYNVLNGACFVICKLK